MKFIIDLIEDVREQIQNQEHYIVKAGLLKEDARDSTKLRYAGEALLGMEKVNDDTKELLFKVGDNSTEMRIGALIPPLLILGMEAMMYELKMDVNSQYRNMEIVGFGKNEETSSYLLFIKI
jgi:hypothetical protein